MFEIMPAGPLASSGSTVVIAVVAFVVVVSFAVRVRRRGLKAASKRKSGGMPGAGT